MPPVQVAECETAADVRRQLRKVAIRRQMWNTPKQPPVLEIVSKKTEPAVLPKEDVQSAVQTDDEIIAEIKRLSEELQKRNVIIPVAARPMIRDVMQAVAAAYGFSMNDMQADRRDARVCQARQVSYLLCKILTQHSLPTIGRAFHRDHTTVLHGIRKVAWLRSALEAIHTVFDPLSAWAATAARLHPLPAVTRDYGQHDRRLK